jgi:hypothetical protein
MDPTTSTSDPPYFRSSFARDTTILNLSLARLVEDAVRSFYAAGESDTTLFSTRGILARQRLTLQLEQLASRITTTLSPETGFDTTHGQGLRVDIRRLWCAILLTQ